MTEHMREDPGALHALRQGRISIEGNGTATGEPDIAVISMSARALADSVANARDKAARTIAAIMSVLQDAGVADSDVRTSRFSISPRYNHLKDKKAKLIGYEVSNTISVTAHDLDGVGALLDRVADAGGDATRVNGVSFRVEDTAALEQEARINAIEDVKAKADLYAERLGFSRVRVLDVRETDFRSTRIPNDAFGPPSLLAFAPQAAPEPTQIFSGDCELSVRVQVAFAIE